MQQRTRVRFPPPPPTCRTKSEYFVIGVGDEDYRLGSAILVGFKLPITFSSVLVGQRHRPRRTDYDVRDVYLDRLRHGVENGFRDIVRVAK